MKMSTPVPISKIFDSNNQYIIPRFQRKYEWQRDDEVSTLWEDIINACEGNKNHFIGSIIMIPVRNDSSKFLLIDGQQRLMTLSLLYRALYEFTDNSTDDKWNDCCKKAFYLEEENCRRIERCSDDATNYSKIINNKSHYNGNYDRVDRCYQFFYKELKIIRDSPDQITIKDILTTLRDRITIMPINVDNEDPCVLFESVNNRGKKLSPVSMMRNYVMLKCVALENEDEFGEIQKEIDNTYWKPFNNLNDNEKILGEYLRTFLTIEMGRVTRDDLYIKIKEKIEKEFSSAVDLESARIAADQLLTPLTDNYRYYQWILDADMISGTSIDWIHIRDSINIINNYGFKSHYSFFLKLFIDYNSHIDDDGKIPSNYLEDLKDKIQLIESFIVRRAIVQDLPNNTVDVMFINLCKEKNLSKEQLKKVLLSQEKRGIWPDDDMVIDAIKRKDFYGTSREMFCYTVLERICAHILDNYTERIKDPRPTCEHIFPQDSTKWKKSFETPDEYDYMVEHTHRLGNLTPLTSPKNSKASHKKYSDKLLTYKTSQYKLTNTIEELYGIHWNKMCFEKRQDDLTKYILEIWKR